MSKTIKELADELGISKSGVRKYMSPSFRARYTFKNANCILIKDVGVKEIKSKIVHSRVHSERAQDTLENVYIDTSGVRYEEEIVNQLKQKGPTNTTITKVT